MYIQGTCTLFCTHNLYAYKHNKVSFYRATNSMQVNYIDIIKTLQSQHPKIEGQRVLDSTSSVCQGISS